MTTIPCFAAVGTARAELPTNKVFKGTLLYWLVASYVVSMAVYSIGTWWWTAFIWAALLVGSILLIKARNRKGAQVKAKNI